jgi:hypothetical protein
MHNLYFDLLITEVDINELKWEPVTHEGITATVTNVVPNDYWIPDEDRGQVVARVRLRSPKGIPPSQIKPRLPQTFELVGRDINTGDGVVKYGFVLKQWFVIRDRATYSDNLAWCNSLGYRMPRVRDLTNSNYKNLGTTPSSSGNNYMRHIGAGFFSEWGFMLDYADSVSRDFGYWTSDASGSGQFSVSSHGGNVHSLSADYSNYEICTTP